MNFHSMRSSCLFNRGATFRKWSQITFKMQTEQSWQS